MARAQDACVVERVSCNEVLGSKQLIAIVSDCEFTTGAEVLVQHYDVLITKRHR